MEKLTVKLKQHTPLIHFQHYQENPTLRASEVKPRLDRYILETLGDGDYRTGCEKASERGWIIGENALNYKLRIRPCNKVNIALDSKFPLVLSNMGNKNKDSVGFSMYESVELSFLFFNCEELCSLIKRYIIQFFAYNNFGQRSSKGFGSFTVIKIDGEEIKWKHSEIYDDGVKLMRYEYDEEDSFSTLFSTIDFYWKLLKSGINYSYRKIERNGVVRRLKENQYEKAFLWEYLEQQHLTWEKRQVKLALDLAGYPVVNEQPHMDGGFDSFFARAHLGCPIQGITYRINTGVYMNGKEEKNEIDIAINNDGDIKRIPAPIIFKPVFHKVKDKDFVSIYILFNNVVIKELNSIDRDIIFNFRRTDDDRNVDVRLFPLTNREYNIDYERLINKFHEKLKNKMAPKDFKWNNILGDKRFVKFYRIEKK